MILFILKGMWIPHPFCSKRLKFLKEGIKSIMKKIRFVSILLIMIVSVLPVICILMIHHISLCKTIENIEEGSFGKSLCMAHIKENSSEPGYEFYEALMEQNVSCGIYLDDKESVEKIVRYMAFTKDYIDFPMQMGRYDFTGNRIS